MSKNYYRLLNIMAMVGITTLRDITFKQGNVGMWTVVG